MQSKFERGTLPVSYICQVRLRRENLKNLCKHAASKLFDEIDIFSEKMSCFTDNFLGNKNYSDKFFNYLVCK